MAGKTQVIDLTGYRMKREAIGDFARYAMKTGDPRASVTFQVAAKAAMTQAGVQRMQFDGFQVAMVDGQAMIRGRCKCR